MTGSITTTLFDFDLPSSILNPRPNFPLSYAHLAAYLPRQ
jgi:hypothetical protein